MAIIKSISGIRGTIGGHQGTNLTPIDIVECVAGFGSWMLAKNKLKKVVVGRDGRISGPMVSQLAVQTLLGMGIDVVDIGLSTTPTVEMAVTDLKAGAGIIFTASHNPKEWNALKFLNEKGEFISAQDGIEILDAIEKKTLFFAEVDHLGHYQLLDYGYQHHIDQILSLPYVNVESIKKAHIHVVIDAINSTGAVAIPALLDQLGVTYTIINGEVNGDFAHNPEPLEIHLEDLMNTVKSKEAHMGISVDPDVDRLCFISEDGSMFGEEYTLVAIADYILGIKKGSTVSNLSSTRALKDIADRHGVEYAAAAVGEVNVVQKMKEIKAVIGGEGNGGIILPELHYGRDALVGIAIFLTLYVDRGLPMSALKKTYPHYEMVKDKVSIEGKNVDEILDKIKSAFKNEKINEVDGVKIDLQEGWIHIRKSNTEPIIRIYTEASSKEIAQNLVNSVKNLVI